LGVEQLNRKAIFALLAWLLPNLATNLLLLASCTPSCMTHAGDLILTGTPEGVSALRHGDKVVAQAHTEDRRLLSEGSWEVVHITST